MVAAEMVEVATVVAAMVADSAVQTERLAHLAGWEVAERAVVDWEVAAMVVAATEWAKLVETTEAEASMAARVVWMAAVACREGAATTVETVADCRHTMRDLQAAIAPLLLMEHPHKPQARQQVRV